MLDWKQLIVSSGSLDPRRSMIERSARTTSEIPNYLSVRLKNPGHSTWLICMYWLMGNHSHKDITVIHSFSICARHFINSRLKNYVQTVMDYFTNKMAVLYWESSKFGSINIFSYEYISIFWNGWRGFYVLLAYFVINCTFPRNLHIFRIMSLYNNAERIDITYTLLFYLTKRKRSNVCVSENIIFISYKSRLSGNFTSKDCANRYLTGIVQPLVPCII